MLSPLSWMESRPWASKTVQVDAVSCMASEILWLQCSQVFFVEFCCCCCPTPNTCYMSPAVFPSIALWKARRGLGLWGGSRHKLILRTRKWEERGCWSLVCPNCHPTAPHSTSYQKSISRVVRGTMFLSSRPKPLLLHTMMLSPLGLCAKKKKKIETFLKAIRKIHQWPSQQNNVTFPRNCNNYPRL